MKKALKWAAIVLGVVLVVVIVGGLVRGGEWSVSRSIVIDAPPEEVHPHINNLKRWEAWSPFEKELFETDPTFEIHYEDQVEGVGASRSWDSEQGPGGMKIVESDAQKGVTFELWMQGFEPFHGKLEYEPVEGGTKVTWTDWGDMGGNPVVGWLAMSMDSMMGPYFESGLADLKQVVEAPAEQPSPDDG